MKTSILTLIAGTLVSTAALAGAVTKWEGTGASYSLDGQQLSSYKVSVVNTEVEQNVIQSETTLTMEDGSQKVISQKITSNGNKWLVQSNLGNGGGACYGNDMCENYIADDKGMAYATTISIDSCTQRRDMTTVLQDGKAIKVLRDNLTRLQ